MQIPSEWIVENGIFCNGAIDVETLIRRLKKARRMKPCYLEQYSFRVRFPIGWPGFYSEQPKDPLFGLPPHIENRVREKFRSEPLRGIVSRTGRRWRKVDEVQHRKPKVSEGMNVLTVHFGSLGSELSNLLRSSGGPYPTVFFGAPHRKWQTVEAI